MPFHAKDALPFCLRVLKDYRIARQNIICVGDEVDQYFGGVYEKDPDAGLSPKTELEATRAELRHWYRAFPEMRLCISNHGIRWARKAFEAGVPSELLRPWRDVIQAPAGWKWRQRWDIPTKAPWSVIHGMGYSGINGHRTAALDLGRSVAIGHLHGHGGVARITTETQAIWGMNTGCLIDVEAYAFNYGKYSRFKPTLGVGVVLDDGRTPVFVPYP